MRKTENIKNDEKLHLSASQLRVKREEYMNMIHVNFAFPKQFLFFNVHFFYILVLVNNLVIW